MGLYFKEDVILSNPNDLVEVRHIVLKRTNYEIGKKLAQIARERHHIEREMCNDRLRARCQRIYMQRNYPIHYERMKGYADAYEVNVDNDAFDFSVLGNPLEGIGCSAVYYPPNMTQSGHSILSKNEDLNTLKTLANGFGLNGDPGDVYMMEKPYIAEIYPDQGYPSLFLFSYELFGEALEGMNSEGLIVTHLADCESAGMEATMSHSIGINELKSIQLLLDTCSNVEEAKQTLLVNKHFYMLIPVHLLIADRFGNSFVWEYSHAHNKEYIIEGDNNPQILTNFLIHRYSSLDDIPLVNKEKGCMYNRYRTLVNEIKQCNNKIDLDFIKETNAKVFIDDTSFSQPTDLRTVWHSIFDANERSLEISFHLRDDMDLYDTKVRKPIRSDYYKFFLSSN